MLQDSTPGPPPACINSVQVDVSFLMSLDLIPLYVRGTVDSERRSNPAEPSRWFLGEFPNLSWFWLVMNVDASGDCVGPLPFLRPILP